MIDAAVVFFSVYWYLMYQARQPLVLVEVAVMALTLGYVLLCVYTPQNTRRVLRWKTVLIIAIIACTTIFSMLDQIALRYQYEPHNFIHDHPLQIEEGLRLLSAGKNPYTHDYRGTALERWSKEYNPAVDHFISLPFDVIKSLPLFIVLQKTVNWYDDRFTHLMLLILALYGVYHLYNRHTYKMAALVVVGLNPLLTPYIIEGRTDIVFLSLIVLSLLLLKKRRYTPSLMMMALAVTTKHTSWFILPFFLWYVYLEGYLKQQPLRRLMPLIVPVVILILPFIIWDWRSFYEDVYAYPAGTVPTSYPIKGYGISPLLVHLGFIESYTSYFPFGILQLVLLPLVWWLLQVQRHRNTIGQILINYGIAVWVFWMLARFFNDNYVGVVAVLLALGALLVMDESVSVPIGKKRQTAQEEAPVLVPARR